MKIIPPRPSDRRESEFAPVAIAGRLIPVSRVVRALLDKEILAAVEAHVEALGEAVQDKHVAAILGQVIESTWAKRGASGQ